MGQVLCFALRFDDRYTKATGWEWETISRKQKKERGHKEAESIEMPLRRHAFESASLGWLRLNSMVWYDTGIIVQLNCRLGWRAKNWWHLHRRGEAIAFFFFNGGTSRVTASYVRRLRITKLSYRTSTHRYIVNLYRWRTLVCMRTIIILLVARLL